MKNLFLLLLVFALKFQLLGQTNRFENNILDFEKQDSIQWPPQQANLFVGSSSIYFWKNISMDFEGYKIINRGFGGSNLVDLDYFSDRIITKYNPAKIFIYSGENDINDGISALETFNRFKKVYEKIRKTLPETPVLFISIKPSIARWAQYPTQKETNKLIKDFLKHENKAQFVNIANKMLIKRRPNPSIFIVDKLHMNQKGYEIWTKKLKKYLVL